ncbi:hypothetical protein [Polymorphobacter megasporae]|uniref:hypothetical protein n=1 Tax=Glacieibacterium megasporae TaxID=2835787 RepID=UPI001C1E3B59|nr:hypothetical protein [Polymorphobacter megasporae]UAJ12477.1 hypothetical protein KTC28_21985 [Polymorphobacter megasporae]
MPMEDDEPTQETYFDVFGPFELDRGCIIKGSVQADLWEKLAKHPKAHAGSLKIKLPQAIGCYLFALQRGDRTPVPWYVGMTVATGGFKAEAFQPHKLEIYRQVLKDCPRGGRPVMFFLPLVLRGARYRFGKGRSKRPTILWLERMLMGFAYWQNENLANKRDTKLLRNVTVRGILGKAPPGRTKTDVEVAWRTLYGDYE